MDYLYSHPHLSTIKSYLSEAKTIAIVGLSQRQETAAYQVASYLQEAGYRIVPVNPQLSGQSILGEEVYARLQDIPFAIDIVDIFRRSEFLPEVARDFLETEAKLFWAQLGLVSQEAGQLLTDHGVDAIIMDRCIKVDHAQLIGHKSKN